MPGGFCLYEPMNLCVSQNVLWEFVERLPFISAKPITLRYLRREKDPKTWKSK